MDLVRSLVWLPFGLILAGGVVMMIVVLLRLVFAARKRKMREAESTGMADRRRPRRR
jgi:hypothetical protein